MPGTERPDPHSVLGVRREASADEIREAYRRLANELHPDRLGPQGAARMAEINDAYRALRAAPTRRERPAPHVTPPDEPPAFRHPVTAPRIPWRGVAILAVIGSIGVVVAAQVIRAPDEPGPDNILRPGSCVTIEANRDAREVTCDGTSDLVVRTLVGFEEACPYGTAAHRDRQGMGWACVVDDT